MNAKTLSLVAVAIAVGGVAFLAFKDYLISSNPIGLTIQGLAFGLMLWARITFGRRSFHAGANPTEGEMVTRGPYRYLRHPIYAAATYFILAGVASHHSTEAIAVAILVVLSLVVRILLEEQFLRAAYPDYEDYSKTTKRIIPFVF